MTRSAAAALLAAAAIVPLATAATPAPARVQVSADEFSLALSRASLRSGPAIVELVNYGEDDHDLALRRVARGAKTYRIGIVHPGQTGDLETTAAPGHLPALVHARRPPGTRDDARRCVVRASGER